MKIGIITYDKYHLKTHQLLNNLFHKKYEIILILTTFKNFKKRKVFFKHRPDQFNFHITNSYLKNENYKKIKLKNLSNYNFKYILVAGSGIINKQNIIKNKIINCHSGLIPSSRGLDSFKWAIKNLDQIGNTLHYIDDKVDLGKIISHKTTNIFKNDNLQKFALRHYKSEIDMLSNFEYYLKNKKTIKLKKTNANLRMKYLDEKNLFQDFKKYKKKYLN